MFKIGDKITVFGPFSKMYKDGIFKITHIHVAPNNVVYDVKALDTTAKLSGLVAITSSYCHYASYMDWNNI